MALTGNERLEVQGVSANGLPAAGTQITTVGAIAALASNFTNDSPSSLTTTVGTTIPAALLITGLLNRTGPTANYTDTTDTAANIVAALGGIVGNSFYIDIKNVTAFTQTLNGGVGVTMSVKNIVPPNSIVEYLVQVVSATSVSFSHIFTTVLTPNPLLAVTALSTVGAGTVTAAGIATGITQRTGAQSGTPFTDTTDIAANIIAALPNAYIGQSWPYTYQNSTNAVATLGGGTGVTVSGVTTIPANASVQYIATYTAANTITLVAYAQGFLANAGTVVLTGTTAVTVNNVNITAGSSVPFTLKTVGGTVGAYPTIKTITAGTGFTVAGTAGDTSTYNYTILG